MRYVALLRGINVGGRTIKMADLKACFEDMGFKNVFTILQTGNVVFESNTARLHPAVGELKEKIEAGLSKAFDYSAKAQVVSIENLKKIVADYPFGLPASRQGKAELNQHEYVIFLENNLEQSLLAEPYALAKNERVKAGNGVVYWRVDKGDTLKSSFAKFLTKTKYKNFNTNRNIKTLRKLLS